MSYYLSWFKTHAFLLDSKPTTTAAALTGEITDINSITGGNPTVNIKENYHIDGDGYASKTPISKNVEDIEINFDRAADAIYSTSGTDTYSKFRSWEENNGSTHKYLVVIVYRGKTGSSPADTWEGTLYDVVPASRSDGEKGPDDIQNITQRLAVSGGLTNLVITHSQDGTFSAALPE